MWPRPVVVLEPQSFGEIVLEHATPHFVRRVDPYLKEMIHVVCLFESLKGAKNKRAMTACIVQYLQAHTHVSIPMYLYRTLCRIRSVEDWTRGDGDILGQMLDEAFGTGVFEEREDGYYLLDAQSGEWMPWYTAVDMAFSNWKSFRHSKLATSFTNLVNVIVSAGLCSTANLDFKIGNVKLFTPMVQKKQLAAGDVFEAFYESVAGFMKGGWSVYKNGKISSFFLEEDIGEFETMYAKLKSMHGYAIAGNLEEYTDLDQNTYEVKLQEAISLGENLYRKLKKGETFERKFLSDRLDRLRDNMTEFVQIQVRGGLRISPFSVSLFGQSGCGKSSLTNLTLAAGLTYNGLDASRERIATWADNDKYASNIRSYINAIVFDDFANTRERFMDFSPAYRLIQVINNVKYLAPMADVFLKGKVALNPYFCLISTNVEFLNSQVYSNEPESVLRRMYHVKVVPRPEFCVNGILNKDKIASRFGLVEAPDIWLLTIRKYDVMNKRHIDPEGMKPIVFEGKRMIDIDVYEYLRWVQIASKRHFEEERSFLKTQAEKPAMCGYCGLVYCNCYKNIIDSVKKEMSDAQDLRERLGAREPDTVLDRQSGYLSWNHCTSRDPDAIKNGEAPGYVYVKPVTWFAFFGKVYYTVSGCISRGYDTFLEKHSADIKRTFNCAKEKTVLEVVEWSNWWDSLDLIPEEVVCHPYVLRFLLLFWARDFFKSLRNGLICIAVFHLFFLWNFSFLWFCWLPLWLLESYAFICCTRQTYELMARQRMLDLRETVRYYLDSWHCKYALIGVGAVAIILKALKSRKMVLDGNTGLQPETMDEIKERDSKENPWANCNSHPLPMSSPARTSKAEDVAKALRVNLVGVVSDTSKCTLGFFITSNFMVVPRHFVEEHHVDGKRDIPIRCYRGSKKDVGGMFEDKLSVEYMRYIPDTDYAVCYVTSGGTFKDMRGFLPTDEQIRKCPAIIVTRETDKPVYSQTQMFFQGTSSVRTKCFAEDNAVRTFKGGMYDLPFETWKGMCMSPVLSDSIGCCILGFHLGGSGRVGGCGVLTQKMFANALNELAGVDGVVLGTSAGIHTILEAEMGDFPEETYGKPILQNKEVHKKSATRFLPEGANIDMYGSVDCRVTPHSNVVLTLISPFVEKCMDVANKWGPPKMKGKGVYPYQAALAVSCIPSKPIGSPLRRAVIDYKKIAANVRKRLPELFKMAAPLGEVETVSGLIGIKFIDPMNFTTSPGYPFSGPKIEKTDELNPEDYPHVGRPRTFKPEVWQEVQKAREILLSGQRFYALWKACLKDEATKLTKDKVRVFQSAPLVIQILVRMYFLPIVRIIQLNPIAFECAVGVNAEGPEWQELWDAAMSKGADRVLAGDYKSYDARMPAQCTIAAFDILIDIAEQCGGYTEEDIKLMKAMVHEVVYPVLVYNGDLIQLFGTNPSGQNLTVIINCIVNSLFLRSSFYSMYPEKDFKEECSFLTYGDDVIGTVSENCKRFNHMTYAAWLKERDIMFTMPDKEADPVPFLNELEVDFLKRKCRYNPDLGMKVGLLDEDSIYKRLHNHILSKELTLEEHSAQNIETSLHDWFFYGRDVFEDRRNKLRAVAREAGILHMCSALDVSYDKRVLKWRVKYLDEYPDLELDEYDESSPYSVLN
jgi:hypothetical protein